MEFKHVYNGTRSELLKSLEVTNILSTIIFVNNYHNNIIIIIVWRYSHIGSVNYLAFKYQKGRLNCCRMAN